MAAGRQRGCRWGARPRLPSARVIPRHPPPASAHCLVVDDDPQVRHALARVIQAHGLATRRGLSGAEALAILESQGEVPLVISDIHMPEMDGVTFLREALRRYPDMAVIMLTGVAEVTTAVECLKLGALDYISKPVLLERSGPGWTRRWRSATWCSRTGSTSSTSRAASGSSTGATSSP